MNSTAGDRVAVVLWLIIAVLFFGGGCWERNDVEGKADTADIAECQKL